MSSPASASEHSRLAALISAASMPSQLPQCRRPLRASRFRFMMLAARFKQCALMPLVASPLFSALVGGSDLVHLGACGKLLKKSQGDKQLMCWGVDENIIRCRFFLFGGIFRRMFGLAKIKSLYSCITIFSIYYLFRCLYKDAKD